MQELPVHLLVSILGHLDGCEISRAAVACRSFREAATEEKLWESLCRQLCALLPALKAQLDEPLSWRQLYLQHMIAPNATDLPDELLPPAPSRTDYLVGMELFAKFREAKDYVGLELVFAQLVELDACADDVQIAKLSTGARDRPEVDNEDAYYARVYLVSKTSGKQLRLLGLQRISDLTLHWHERSEEEKAEDFKEASGICYSLDTTFTCPEFWVDLQVDVYDDSDEVSAEEAYGTRTVVGVSVGIDETMLEEGYGWNYIDGQPWLDDADKAHRQHIKGIPDLLRALDRPVCTSRWVQPPMCVAPAGMNNEANQQSPITNLPEHLLRSIMSHLDNIEDVIQVGAACRVLRLAAAQEDLWEALCRSDIVPRYPLVPAIRKRLGSIISWKQLYVQHTSLAAGCAANPPRMYLPAPPERSAYLVGVEVGDAVSVLLSSLEELDAWPDSYDVAIHNQVFAHIRMKKSGPILLVTKKSKLYVSAFLVRKSDAKRMQLLHKGELEYDPEYGNKGTRWTDCEIEGFHTKEFYFRLQTDIYDVDAEDDKFSHLTGIRIALNWFSLCSIGEHLQHLGTVREILQALERPHCASRWV